MYSISAKKEIQGKSGRKFTERGEKLQVPQSLSSQKEESCEKGSGFHSFRLQESVEKNNTTALLPYKWRRDLKEQDRSF